MQSFSWCLLLINEWVSLILADWEIRHTYHLLLIKEWSSLNLTHIPFMYSLILICCGPFYSVYALIYGVVFHYKLTTYFETSVMWITFVCWAKGNIYYHDLRKKKNLFCFIHNITILIATCSTKSFLMVLLIMFQ